MLGTTTFDWARLWCDPAGTYHSDAFGYLLDPTDMPELNLECRSFDEIASTSCLALLGEPGIGKSGAIRELARTRTHAAVVDLSAYASAADVDSGLFHHARVHTWLERDNDSLELFLDGFDECHVRIQVLAARIVTWLESIPRHRLKLRIACRTAVWPAELQSALTVLFSGEAQEYELLPLRRKEVVLAAEEEFGSGALDFMRAVEAQGSVPLAIKPISLWMLIHMWRESGRLEESAVGLFESACLRMCQDPASLTIRPRTSTAQERLGLGRRLAVALALSNGDAVVDESSTLSGTSNGAIRVSEVLGLRQELARAASEVLDTGLFSRRGESSFGFYHKSIQDYLAAAELARSPHADATIVALVTDSSLGRREVVPQLRGVATWLALQREGLMATLIQVDPLLALEATLLPGREAAQARIVGEVLGALSSGQASIADWSILRRLGQLQRGGLVGVVSPYLADRSLAREARSFALAIARMAPSEDFLPALTQVVQDEDEDPRLRVDGAEALGEIRSPNAVAVLRSLLDLPQEADELAELRGAALSALWPNSVSVSSVLEVVRGASHGDLMGNYWRFLRTEFVPGLHDEDLIEVLDWIAAAGPSWDLSYDLQQLRKDVFEAAESRIEQIEIRDAYASTIALSLRRGEESWTGLSRAQRRPLLLEVLRRIGSPKEAGVLAWGTEALARREDVEWLFEVVQSVGAPVDAIARLLVRLIDVTDRDQVRAFWLARGVSAVEEAFRGTLQAVDLESEESKWMKRAHQPEEADQNQYGTFDASRLQSLLSEIDEGEPAAWWRANLVLSGTQIGHQEEFETDISSLTSWTHLSHAERAAVVRAAAQYLRSADPASLEQPQEGIFSRPYHSAFRALRLVNEFGASGLDDGQPPSIARWASVVLSFPSWRGRGTVEAARDIACQMYRQDPSGCRSYVLRAIEEDDFGPLSMLASCWDKALMDLAVSAIKETSNWESAVAMFAIVADADTATAKQLAFDLLSAATDKDDATVFLAGVARELLERSGSDAWRILQDVRALNEGVARDALLQIAHQGSAGRAILGSLSEDDLASLYLVLEELFPEADDPNPIGAHIVTAREDLGRWRGQVIVALRERATPEAIAALRSLQSSYPNAEWLSRSVREAEQSLLRSSWHPLPVAEVASLLDDHRYQPVRTGDQLLALLQLAIDSYGKELQGEPALVTNLWHKTDSGWLPREEAALSDNLAVRIREYLEHQVVVNREVQIRPPRMGSKGEQTDIHIDVPAAQDSGPLRVVIEVKGSWNPNVISDLGNQLLERYLLSHGSSLGMYVVGYYESPSWPSSDHRRGKARRWASGEKLEEALQQGMPSVPSGVSVIPTVIDCSIRGELND